MTYDIMANHYYYNEGTPDGFIAVINRSCKSGDTIMKSRVNYPVVILRIKQ